MPNYRRAFVPEGCWFFKANLLDRRSSPLTGQIRDVAAGLFPKDWAGELETRGESGEVRVAQ